MKDRSRPRQPVRGLAWYMAFFDAPPSAPGPSSAPASAPPPAPPDTSSAVVPGTTSAAGPSPAPGTPPAQPGMSSALVPGMTSAVGPSPSSSSSSSIAAWGVGRAVVAGYQSVQHEPITPMEAHDRLGPLLVRSFRPRQWEVVDRDCPATLSVISYNLLSNALARRCAKFRGVQWRPDPLLWDARRTLLLNEITALNADIVCVQELDEQDYDGAFGTAMVGLGYKSVFRRKRRDLVHGMVIFYRSGRITLVQNCPVPCLQGKVQPGLDHAGVVLVLEVSTGSTQRRVCVATTHLMNGGERDLKKLGQLFLLTTAVEAQLRENPAMPLILTGDFNDRLDNEMIWYLTKGAAMIPTSTPAEVFERFRLETWDVRKAVVPSAFATKAEELRALIGTLRNDLIQPVMTQPVYMSSVYRLKSVVDHIFQGQIGESPLMKLVSRLELPESLAQLKNGLPAAHLGSDHFALGAKFCFVDEVDEVEEADDVEDDQEE
ncbi:Protein angel 2 [Mortierella alpina]|nr:Protein angel 2 [Mortierella alpina]